MCTDKIVIELGKRVLKLRQKLGISQADLAMRADISKTYLGEFERGQRTNISISAIARIADSLGATISELFADIEQEDLSWENDDTLTNALYQRRMEDACYPPKFEHYSVTTLMQFLVYLPLIKPQLLLDSLQRIGGSYAGYESYVMKQINFCISKIPQSPAREYADACAMSLTRDNYIRNKHGLEELNDSSATGYEAYIDRIKCMDQFIKACLIMKESIDENVSW